MKGAMSGPARFQILFDLSRHFFRIFSDRPGIIKIPILTSETVIVGSILMHFKPKTINSGLKICFPINDMIFYRYLRIKTSTFSKITPQTALKISIPIIYIVIQGVNFRPGPRAGAKKLRALLKPNTTLFGHFYGFSPFLHFLVKYFEEFHCHPFEPSAKFLRPTVTVMIQKIVLK